MPMDDVDEAYDPGDDHNQLDASNLLVQQPCSVFPLGLFRQLFKDLTATRWTIHYDNVETCVQSIEEILAGGSRSAADRSAAEEFIRLVLQDAIAKGVVESNHRTWSLPIRISLLNTLIALASACGAGLLSLRVSSDDLWSNEQHVQPTRRVDLVASLLVLLSHVFDSRSSFSETFAHEKIPSQCLEKVHKTISTMPDFVPKWTAAVAAKFMEVEGFILIFEVMESLPFEVKLIDSLIRPLAVGEYLVQFQNSQGVFAAAEIHPKATLCQVLKKMSASLDPNDSTIPSLSDTELAMLAGMFNRLYTVCSIFFDEEEAIKEVLKVNIGYLQALLAKRSFATLLVLANETNKLFRKFDKYPEAKRRSALEPLLSWIDHEQVVQQLLGANMHQRQYVEALQELLIFLAKSGALTETVVTKLVANMLQEGVMDVEKDNIAKLLKRVVRVADPDVVLAAKNAVTPASIKTSSNAKAVFSLILAMTSNSLLQEKQDLVLQCLDIGWNLLLSADHSHLVISSPTAQDNGRGQNNMFVFVVVNSDAAWSKVDTPAGFGMIYANKCLQCIKDRQNLPQTLHTLQYMLKSNMEVRPAQSSLVDAQAALSVVINSLCEWIQNMVTKSGKLEGGAVSPGAEGRMFSVTFRRYLELIQFIALKLLTSNENTGDQGGQSSVMSSQLVSRLWESTICTIPDDSSSLEKEVEFAFAFFASLIDADAIPLDAVCEIVDNAAHLRPPQFVTSRSLEKLFHIISHANIHMGTMVELESLPGNSMTGARHEYAVNPEAGKLVGMDYLFLVLIHAQDEHVAREAANMLVMVYIKPYRDFQRCFPSWTMFVENVVNKLSQYASALAQGQSAGVIQDAETWCQVAHASTENPNATEVNENCSLAQRTMLLLAQIVDSCHGISMPIMRPHRAAAKGYPIEMVVHGLASPPKLKCTYADIPIQLDRNKNSVILGVHSHMYLGDVRQILEQISGCVPGHLIIMVMGKKQINDSEQLGTINQPAFDTPNGCHRSSRLPVHVMAPNQQQLVAQQAMGQPGSVHVLPDAVRETVMQSSPDVTMASNAVLMHMLMYLLDMPTAAPHVHHKAHQMLCCLQTWQPLVAALQRSLQPTAGGGRDVPPPIRELFFVPPNPQPVQHASWKPQPGALLYTLEALYALMEPTLSPTNSDHHTFPCCPNKAILLIIEALQANYVPSRADKHFWLYFYNTAFNVLRWVLSQAKLPPGVEPAETSQTSGADGLRQATMRSEEVASDLNPSPAINHSGDADGRAVSSNPASGSNIRIPGDAVLDSSSSSDCASGSRQEQQQTLDMDVVGKLLDFWIILATRLSHGLPESDTGAGAAPRWGPALGLSERHLHDSVMTIIQTLVRSRSALLEGVIFSESFAEMSRELLFNPNDLAIREGMLNLLEACVSSATPSGRCHLVKAMASKNMQEYAQREAVHCQQYYLALSSIVTSSAEAMDENCVQHLQQLFTDELAYLHNLDSPTTEQLIGRLTFLTSLWRFFVEHPSNASPEMLASMRDNSTVSLILDSLLFPEAQHIRCDIEGQDNNAAAENAEAAATPICSSVESRKAAYALLHTIVSYTDTTTRYCLCRFLDMLAPGPSNHALLRQQHAQHVEYAQRLSNDSVVLSDCTKWRGLVNAGATCYMNAVVQQLFMQPTVRALVLARDAPATEDEDEDTFFQIQRTFAHLALSTARSFSPNGVWSSLKDQDGNPINVMEHQDAHEHLYQLHNIIDGNEPSETSENMPMFAAMGGTTVQLITCRTVDYVSRRTEPFTHISVDVQNMQNLQRALEVFFQEELMEGDNAYHCDKVDAKVPAIKRTLLEKLPHTFVVQLKRFEFDYCNGMRLKIQDRFEFPLTLDLRQYSEEEMMKAEAASGSSPASGSKRVPKREQHPDSYFQYELKGVVVHTGSAFAGHYYSLVKERGPQGTWLCMDDTSVTMWDPSHMDECCFGGPGVGAHMRPNSAYMLVYERQDRMEPVLVREELRGLLRNAAERGVTVGASDKFLPAQSTEVGAETHAWLSLGLPQRLHSEVMQQNLLMSHAAHWTAPMHILFMKAILSECLQINSSSDCHDIRHSMASGSISGVKTLSCDTREANSKRIALSAQRLDAAQPLPIVAEAVPEDVTKEELATRLALKYYLAVLNYVPEIDENIMAFFLDSIEHGMVRTSKMEPCVDLVLQSLCWRTPDVKMVVYGHENAALSVERSTRHLWHRAAVRVLTVVSQELVVGNLDRTNPATPPLVVKVQQFADCAWSVLRDYLPCKMSFFVDGLALCIAELCGQNSKLRAIMDQADPAPFDVINHSLTYMFQDQGIDPTNRVVNIFWRLCRTVLFNVADAGSNPEKLVLRPGFLPSTNVAPEDAFIMQRSSAYLKTFMDLLCHTEALVKMAEMTLNSSPKSYDKNRDFYLGPIRAMLRASPETGRIATFAILSSFEDVTHLDDEDGEYSDRTSLLVASLLLLDAPSTCRQNLNELFCYNVRRLDHRPIGLFASIENLVGTYHRRQHTAALLMQGFRTFCNIVGFIHDQNPSLHDYAVPAEPADAEHAAQVMTEMYHIMQQYPQLQMIMRSTHEAIVSLHNRLVLAGRQR